MVGLDASGLKAASANRGGLGLRKVKREKNSIEQIGRRNKMNPVSAVCSLKGGFDGAGRNSMFR